jgi:hypothetical protein
VLHYAPRHYEVWGSGGVAPRNHNLGIKWRWASLPGEVSPVVFIYEVVWAPQPVWTWRRKKNSRHCPCRELNPGRPACSLVTVMTELDLVNNYETHDSPVIFCNYGDSSRIQVSFLFYLPTFRFCQTSFFTSNYSFHVNHTLLKLHVFLFGFIVAVVTIVLLQDHIAITENMAVH